MLFRHECMKVIFGTACVKFHFNYDKDVRETEFFHALRKTFLFYVRVPIAKSGNLYVHAMKNHFKSYAKVIAAIKTLHHKNK